MASLKVLPEHIDRSIRAPGLFFALSAIVWLMVATCFALVSSVKLHLPEFLASWECLTYGRTFPAYLNALVYGWGSNAIFFVCLWIMARLAKSPLPYQGLLLIAGIFWNMGVTFGVLRILLGDMTSVELLEIPPSLTPLLLFSYALIGIWGVIAFRYRNTEHVYISQAYILAALFWFPWIYTVAQVLVVFAPARGVVQSIVSLWFSYNLLSLWLIPMALATAYYMLPKILGRPIYNYHLSLVGFWALAFLIGWTGMANMNGGPVPVWISTVGTVAGILLVLPLVIIATNFHWTFLGDYKRAFADPLCRFIIFGVVGFTVFGLGIMLTALPPVTIVTQLSYVNSAQFSLGVYAFFTMTLFSAMYFILPRLLNGKWPTTTLINLHFISSGLGVILVVSGLIIAGVTQGMETNAITAEGKPVYPFLEMVSHTLPWLSVQSVGWGLIALGHTAFFINLAWMMWNRIRSLIQEAKAQALPSVGCGTLEA